MMKKLFTLILVALSTVMVASAQEAEYQDKTVQQEDTVKKGVHPYRPVKNLADTLSNWSIYINGGFNVFDGDFTSEKKHGVYAPSVGLGFDYNFNCTWGIGAEYVYRRYKVTGFGTDASAATMLKGQAHQADVYLTFDIFNCFFPKNKFKLFALNLIAGGGAMFWKNDISYGNVVYSDNHGVKEYDRWEYHTGSDNQKLSGLQEPMDKFKATGVFLGGLACEFNVSRDLSLGLKAIYNFTTSDQVDGRVRPENNDGVFDCDLILRWKIAAQKRSNVRNLASLDALNQMLAENHQIPTNASLYPAAGRDTVYIYTHVSTRDTLVMQKTVVSKDTINRNTTSTIIKESVVGGDNDYYFVYFDNAKSIIKNEGLMTIQQVASRMKREPEICAEIIGYCDNTGSNELNNTLGQARAKVVTDELIGEYDINPDRMVSIGRGKIISKRYPGSFSPNRRTEIHLVKKGIFDKLKEQYKDEALQFTQYETAYQQSVREEKNLPQGTLDKVELTQNTTLSKLARRYYHNTFCWVYIYQANMDVIANPNDIEVGTPLIIPELTDTEKKITKEESIEMLEKLQSIAAEKQAQTEE